MSDRPLRRTSSSKADPDDHFSWNEGDVEIVWGPAVFPPVMTEGEEQANLVELLAEVGTRAELKELLPAVEAFCQTYPSNGVVAHALLDATARVDT